MSTKVPQLRTCFGRRRLQPAVELLLPLAEAAPPLLVVGHDAAGAGGNADGDQRIDQYLRELLDSADLVGAQFVAVDDRVVLVGEQRLFAAPLAAEHDKGKALGQVGKSGPGASARSGAGESDR
jgi:hypothetical protein